MTNDRPCSSDRRKQADWWISWLACERHRRFKEGFNIIFKVCPKTTGEHMNTERGFLRSNHSSSQCWLLKDPLQMCFQWKRWRSKSRVILCKNTFISLSEVYMRLPLSELLISSRYPPHLRCLSK